MFWSSDEWWYSNNELFCYMSNIRIPSCSSYPVVSVGVNGLVLMGDVGAVGCGAYEEKYRGVMT